MADLEPGYVTHEEMPFGPRVSRDGLLESLVGELVEIVRGGDQELASASLYVGEGRPDDLPGYYEATIGRAADDTADQAGGINDPTSDRLVDGGGGVDSLRLSVLRFLPQPDAQIDTSFVDPPEPPGDWPRDDWSRGPGGGGGKTGDDGGDDTHDRPPHPGGPPPPPPPEDTGDRTGGTRQPGDPSPTPKPKGDGDGDGSGGSGGPPPPPPPPDDTGGDGGSTGDGDQGDRGERDGGKGRV